MACLFFQSRFTCFIVCIPGPCQFLFDDSLLDGGKSYIQIIGDKRVLLRFGASYENGLLLDRLATVDPGRVKPYDGNPVPDYHEVCLSFTDHKSRACHRNVDICHMEPAPPRAKGQSLLLLCAPSSVSPHGRYGPYIALQVQKKSLNRVTVRDESTRKNVIYNLDQCVRLMEENEAK